MRFRKLILTALTALGACSGLALGSAPASALTGRVSAGSFGPGGPGSGAFSATQSLAVDEATGDVYVYDVGSGVLDKFTAAGEPAEFSVLKKDQIEGVGGALLEAEVAVDNSNGPAKGDIYIANGTHIGIYAADGSTLGELSGEVEEKAGHPWGEPCGVAVDPAGNVYTAHFTGNVNKYTPKTNTLSGGDYVASLTGLEGLCNIAVDAGGDVYTDTWVEGPVQRYPAARFAQPETPGSLIDPHGLTLAVDPSNGFVYVDESARVRQFDATGALLYQFGETGPEPLGISLGIAVNGASGRVYVSDNERGRIDIFDPVVLPDATVGAASDVQAAAVTLNASVNPDGVPVTSCVFGFGIDEGASTIYGQNFPCVPAPGSGGTPVAVGASIGGLVPNTTYRYRLTVTNGNGANESPSATITTAALPPTVNDLPPDASSITRSTALLSGTVNPEHSPTLYYFVYGTTAGYGSTTSPVSAGPLLGDTAVIKSVAGLQAGTVYHYALAAVNQAGVSTGPDHTFTTAPPVLPSVTGVGVSDLAPGAATISGKVESIGVPTTYEIDSGADTTYPTRSAGEIVGAGQAVTLTLLYLQPDTTYHYRVVASNEYGTVATPDQTFTTPRYTLDTPPVLPLIASPSIAFPASSKAQGGQRSKVTGKGGKKRGRKTRARRKRRKKR